MRLFHILPLVALFTLSQSCNSGFDDPEEEPATNTTDDEEKEDDEKEDNQDDATSTCPFAIVDSTIAISANANQMVHITAEVVRVDTTDAEYDDPVVSLIFGKGKDASKYTEPENTASVTLEGFSDIYVLGLGDAGTTYNARLVVSSGDASSQSSTFSIELPSLPEVEKQELQAIDLGLSVLWATTNLGAATDTAEGAHYAFGEIAAKKTFTEDNYAHTGIGIFNFVESISGVSGLDAALAAAGDGWRLPTYDEVRELYKSCAWKAEKISTGKTGMRFTSKSNDNSIILPCAGIKSGRKTVHNDEFDGRETSKLSGYYMTSTMGTDPNVICSLRFTMSSSAYDESIFVSRDEDMWMGFSVRAVRDK